MLSESIGVEFVVETGKFGLNGGAPDLPVVDPAAWQATFQAGAAGFQRVKLHPLDIDLQQIQSWELKRVDRDERFPGLAG